jgi:hypothetical protein
MVLLILAFTASTKNAIATTVFSSYHFRNFKEKKGMFRQVFLFCGVTELKNKDWFEQ